MASVIDKSPLPPSLPPSRNPYLGGEVLEVDVLGDGGLAEGGLQHAQSKEKGGREGGRKGG